MIRLILADDNQPGAPLLQSGPNGSSGRRREAKRRLTNSERLRYENPFLREAEAELCEMMSELTGSEADMAAIREFQKLLGGKS